MLRRVISAIVATAIAITPVSVSAQEYIYRYKFGITESAITPPTTPPTGEETEFAPGNDIDAYYVSPTNFAFSREIPVATNAVVRWERDTGALPEGFEIDNSRGFVEGTSETPQETEALYYGFDKTGKRIARAKVFFEVIEADGSVQEVNYYTHTGRYFHETIPAAVSGVQEWSAVGSNPLGMTTRQTAFEGRPGKAGTYALAWSGKNALGETVAFTFGQMLVEDGPVVEFIEDQVADKNENQTFDARATVLHKIGELSYRLIPVAENPEGLVFSEKDGDVSGVFKNFETSAQYQIEARDNADGRTGLSNVFRLSTTRAVAELADLNDITTTVNQDFARQLRTDRPDLETQWSLISGKLPVGVVLDTVTGLLHGVPTEVGVSEGLMIQATSPHFDTVTSPEFSFTVLPEEIRLKFVDLNERINRTFRTEPVEIESGYHAPMTYENLSSHDELLFSATDGAYYAPEGIAVAGTHSQSMKATNGAGQVGSAVQKIKIFDPLSIAYEPTYEVKRFYGLYVRPQMPEKGVFGRAQFELLEGSLPEWLEFSTASGTFIGTPEKLEDLKMYGPFKVQVTDEFNTPVVSEPFTINAVDRQPVKIEVVEERVQRYVQNEHRVVKASDHIGKVSYSIVKGADKLPTTLRFGDDGILTGKTTLPIGTKFEGMVIRATDGKGYYADTDAFDMEVTEPWSIGPIPPAEPTEFRWSVNRPLIDMSVRSTSDIFGPTRYLISENVFDLKIEDRALIGAISEVGEFTFPYQIDDDTARTPGLGTINMTIIPPIELKAEEGYELYRGEASQISPQTVNGIRPFLYRLLDTSVLPVGMSFNDVTGDLTGTPSVEGNFPIEIEVKDKTQDTRVVAFTVKVNAPKVFGFKYTDDTLFTNSTTAKLTPTVQNKSGDVVWEVTAGQLPPGVTLVKSGATGGQIGGRPTENGIFEGIEIFARDTGTNETHSETITIKVSRTGEPDISEKSLKARKGTPSPLKLEVSNVVDPYVVSFVDGQNPYPGQLTLDERGNMTAQFAEIGSYLAGVAVSDFFERKASANVVIEVVDTLAISMPEVAQFQRFVVKQQTPTVSNNVGTATFNMSAASPELPAGITFNSINGTLTGEAETTGNYGPYVIEVRDGFDGQTARTEAFMINVAPRPQPEMTAPEELTALLNNSYSQSLNPRGTVGDVSLEMLTNADLLPPGVIFSSSLGSFSGRPTTYAKYEGIQVRMTDTYRGEAVAVTKTFSINVVQDGSPIQLTYGEGRTRAGFALTVPPKTLSNTIGDLTWTATGLEGTNLVVDPLTGSLTGTPAAALSARPQITVADITGRSVTATVVIEIVGPIQVSMQQDADLLFNYDYVETTNVHPVASSTYGQKVWSVVNPDALPPGISLDQNTGRFSGTPRERVDAFGPLRIRVTDTLPGAGTSNEFWFTVLMNEDPIELETNDIVTKVGYDFDGAIKSFDNTLGVPRFYSLDLAGTNLQVNESTGTLTGSFATPQDRNINLTITDETLRITTKPIKLQVLPLMSIIAPEVVELEAQEKMTVMTPNRLNVVGDATWHEAVGQLPPGITFDPAKGEFSGTPSFLGTFGPVTVSSTDALGDKGVSNAITFSVSPGSKYLALNAATLPTAVKRTESYSYDLKNHLNAIGISQGQLQWSWSGIQGATPPGLAFTNGVISGTPTTAGTYQFTVRVTGDGRSSEQAYNLTVLQPEISLTLNDVIFEEIGSESALNYNFMSALTAKNIPTADVQWSIDGFAGATIADGALSAHMTSVRIPDGQESVEHSFTVTAAYSNGDEQASVSKSYSIRVKKEIAGATWWRFTPTSKYSTPAGTRPVVMVSIQTADGIGIHLQTDKIVSKTGVIFNTSSNVTSAYVDVGVSHAIQFSEPVNAVQAQLRHSTTTTHPKVAAFRIESSMDGENWTVRYAGSLPSSTPALVTFPFN